MKTRRKLTIKAKAFLLLIAISLTLITRAHEVNGSNVTVTIKNHQVEVMQSTPIKDAREIVAKIGEQSKEAQVILQTMAKQWRIESNSQLCRLEKQAVRSVHHNTQLQMRYLFTCKEGAKPDLMALPWLQQAPDDHFIIMKLMFGSRAKTLIFQKQELVIDLQSHV